MDGGVRGWRIRWEGYGRISRGGKKDDIWMIKGSMV